MFSSPLLNALLFLLFILWWGYPRSSPPLVEINQTKLFYARLPYSPRVSTRRLREEITNSDVTKVVVGAQQSKLDKRKPKADPGVDGLCDSMAMLNIRQKCRKYQSMQSIPIPPPS